MTAPIDEQALEPWWGTGPCPDRADQEPLSVDEENNRADREARWDS